MCVRIVLEMTLLLLPLSSSSETKIHPFLKHLRTFSGQFKTYIICSSSHFYLASKAPRNFLPLSFVLLAFLLIYVCWTCIYSAIIAYIYYINFLQIRKSKYMKCVGVCIWRVYSMQTFKLPWLINLSAHLGQLTKTNETSSKNERIGLNEKKEIMCFKQSIGSKFDYRFGIKKGRLGLKFKRQ